MGDPKFPRKKYETPSHPWEAKRIEREKEMVQKYGLRNKREIWKAETFLRRIRGHARDLFVGAGEEQTEKEKEELLKRMVMLGILSPSSQLDDILALTIEDVLTRRLQMQVYLHGLSYTPKQARQMITHGHIVINGKKVRVPSYMVKKSEESTIQYMSASPFSDEMHPMRPKAEQRTGMNEAEVKEMETKKEV